MVYADIHRSSITDPTAFWGAEQGLVDWVTEPTRVLDETNPPFTRWFPDGELNTAYNALDRHVAAGRGEQTALIYDSPVTDAKARYSYAELRDRVAKVAGALAGLGVTTGDRVLIYMPMIPEAVIAMLACARLGAIHSVVFGGFAAHELALRIDDARPKAILAASAGVEPKRVIAYQPILDEALELATHRPETIVYKQRDAATARIDRPQEHDWDELEAAANPVGCTPVASSDPLYVLYTSGTTGTPKGILRDNGGHAVALTWALKNIFDIAPGQVFWAASDVGWVVGHSFIVYAPLLTGATTVIYEGKPVGTPDAGAFWRVIEEYRVDALFTAPTALRAVKKLDPDAALLAGYDISSLQTLFMAGERLDPDTYEWASEKLGVPVVDNWWQTETGWPIAANLRGLAPMPIKPGTPTVPVPGYDVQVLDEHGQPVPAGTEGTICIRLPLPPGALLTVYNNDDRYVDGYLRGYPGYYLTGDGGFFDEDGYLHVLGRTDDIINVAGHRLSTGAMEGVLSTHPAVAECAVIGVSDPLKGEHPLGLVVLKEGFEIDERVLHDDLVKMVREWIGPVADFKQVITVNALPKTRSGKILRKSMRELANGQEPVVPSTIDDPSVLSALRPVLHPGGDDTTLTGLARVIY